MASFLLLKLELTTFLLRLKIGTLESSELLHNYFLSRKNRECLKAVLSLTGSPLFEWNSNDSVKTDIGRKTKASLTKRVTYNIEEVAAGKIGDLKVDYKDKEINLISLRL